MSKSMFRSGRIRPRLKREYPKLVGKRMGQSTISSKTRKIGNVVLRPGEYIKGGEKRKYNTSLDRSIVSKTKRPASWSPYRGDTEATKI